MGFGVSQNFCFGVLIMHDILYCWPLGDYENAVADFDLS